MLSWPSPRPSSWLLLAPFVLALRRAPRSAWPFPTEPLAPRYFDTTWLLMVRVPKTATTTLLQDILLPAVFASEYVNDHDRHVCFGIPSGVDGRALPQDQWGDTGCHADFCAGGRPLH